MMSNVKVRQTQIMINYLKTIIAAQSALPFSNSLRLLLMLL